MWIALAALGVPEDCDVAVQAPDGSIILIRIDHGIAIGSRPVTDFLPADQQSQEDAQRWVVAATATRDYDAFRVPLQAPSLAALAAAVAGAYPSETDAAG